MAGATSQAADHPLPRAREEVLRRTLRALPDPMLAALRRGLESNANRLVTGHLFRTRKGGGCAVGVMLRELDPELYDRGPLRFWLRDRWRRGARSYRGPLARNPRLKHLEWVFDDLVEDLRADGLSSREAARAAGRCVRREAEDEQRWRATARQFDRGATPSREPQPEPC